MVWCAVRVAVVKLLLVVECWRRQKLEVGRSRVELEMEGPVRSYLGRAALACGAF